MENFRRRIVVERTLEIGNARMQEGDEAYIHFNAQLFMLLPEGTYDAWMYGTIVKLNDDSAWFSIGDAEHTKSGFLLRPEAIVEISEKCPFDDPTPLLMGEFLPAGKGGVHHG